MGSLDTTVSFKDYNRLQYLPTFLCCEMWINTNLIQRFLWNWGTIVLRHQIENTVVSCSWPAWCLPAGGCDLACSLLLSDPEEQDKRMWDWTKAESEDLDTISCNRPWAGVILHAAQQRAGPIIESNCEPPFEHSNRGQIKGYSSVSSSVSAEFRPQLESGQFLLFCSSTQR